MHRTKRLNDAVHWYMNELTSRIVASSGRPSDRFHLGKIILQSLKDAPDFVLQIDGATGERETNGSVLQRSVQCANAFKGLGLQRGDVMVIMAPNHLDSSITIYAALYLGIIYAPIDMTLSIDELQRTFQIERPKIVFCQSDRALDVQQSLEKTGLDAQVILFDKGNNCLTFSELLEKYEDIKTDVEQFKPADFDPEDTIAFLTQTSGTSGVPKACASTHVNFAISAPYLWSMFTNFPTPSSTCLLVSPRQWMTATFIIYLSPVLRFTKLQSSQPMTQDHAYYLINTYKPTFMLLSPTLMTTLIKPGDRDQCDFSCFELIGLGGSAVPSTLIDQIKQMVPDIYVKAMYGMTEMNGAPFLPNFSPQASVGVLVAGLQTRLINIENQEDINEPNVTGELWLKGPTVFKGYHNDLVSTKEAFAEDGWFKSGDLFYRDETWNFYYVDRIKLLLKYRNHQVSPVEVENVIRDHPGVLEVAVTGVPDAECGDLPVACVVRAPGHSVTAHEIKQIVKDTLTDTKQLRGGVVFLDELPLTGIGKINRREIKNMVLHMNRE